MKLTIAIAAALSVFAVGCGSATPSWKTVYPATGKLLFNGTPVAGAQITFTPKDSAVPASVRPSATTDAEGIFKLGTYSLADGAPAGDYHVAVVWHPLVDVGGGPTRGPNKLPERYARAETSLLSATVDSRTTELAPLNLKR
jgi:hypothetical protein